MSPYLIKSAAVLCVAALGLWACSVDEAAAPGADAPASSSPDGAGAADPTEGEAEGADSGDGGSGLEAARAEVEAYTAVPEFTEPGEPLDAREIAEGRTIFSMAVSSGIPYNVAMEEAVEVAAVDAGFRYVGWPTSGLSDEWIQGIQSAINQDVDVINLTAGFDVRQVEPQLREAREAGIKIVASTFGGYTQECPEYVDACIPMNYEQAAVLEADRAIAQAQGEGHIIVVTASDVFSSRAMIPAIEDTFAQNCPDCETTFIDVPVANWATQIQSDVQAALVANPDTKYVITLYDSMISYVVPALLATQLAGQVGINGYNGTPGAMSLLQDGDADMVVGQDILWTGYATIDVNLRLLADVEPNQGLVDQHIPLRVFTQENADEAGDPPTFFGGYGSVAADGYQALWGIG